jgi:hypothetical protein
MFSPSLLAMLLKISLRRSLLTDDLAVFVGWGENAVTNWTGDVLDSAPSDDNSKVAILLTAMERNEALVLMLLSERREEGGEARKIVNNFTVPAKSAI